LPTPGKQVRSLQVQEPKVPLNYSDNAILSRILLSAYAFYSICLALATFQFSAAVFFGLPLVFGIPKSQLAFYKMELMFTTIFLLVALSADLIKAPPSIPTDNGSVVVSDKKGGRRWMANWTMEPAVQNGKKVIRFTEHGQGHITPYSGEVRWSLESVWTADNGLKPLDSEKIVSSISGERLNTERKHFDFNKGTVRVESQPKDGKSEVKTLSIPPDTLTVEGIAGILRYLPFSENMSFPAHLLSNDPRLYSVTFEVRGKERVKTQVGAFEAYKVEMVPHVGALNIFRSFVPKTFFWFTVQPPHFWVRYEGLENGPGTPEIVMELGPGVN
jgi:Protein of unknown function (DUF3108)